MQDKLHTVKETNTNDTMIISKMSGHVSTDDDNFAVFKLHEDVSDEYYRTPEQKEYYNTNYPSILRKERRKFNKSKNGEKY